MIHNTAATTQPNAPQRASTAPLRDRAERCPVHGAQLPCDGDHEARRPAMILRMHAAGDHSYCATMAGCN